MAIPPKRYKGGITRAEWRGVVDFSRAVGAELVTSAAISEGTRGAKGMWTPQQAKALFGHTKSIAGHIAAAEFMNEPTFAIMALRQKMLSVASTCLYSPLSGQVSGDVGAHPCNKS